MKKKPLKYIGGAWLPGVPARDLSEEEVEQYDYELLIKSGLYKEIEPIKEAKYGRNKETSQDSTG